MHIRCIIVDDEAPARDELRFLLSAYEGIDIIDEADSATAAIAKIEELKPDLVFLDIQMPGRNGFEVIKALASETAPKPHYVFATAFDNYAIQAFEASAVDYILKPLSSRRLAQTLEKVRTLIAQKNNSFIEQQLQVLLDKVSPPVRELIKISVEKKGKMRLLSPEEIVFCSYADNHILVHTSNEALPIHGITTMDKLEEHLAGSSFFRVHRAILVNLNAIKEFSPWFHGKYNLIMDDRFATELAVSRSRVREFKMKLGL
ncbi:LytR/AlgR family response regulator transcription factor [Desulfogranum japonicum]|uniref:LytR/AlgR family response regulator transcription factor n=1 Tax=Desulfogranum japonicum TaxID=231447 RepID=UPI000409F82F|nr:LytTR family DNA-binding domain-containing protein [Desulfogranum japonicum]